MPVCCSTHSPVSLCVYVRSPRTIGSSNLPEVTGQIVPYLLTVKLNDAVISMISVLMSVSDSRIKGSVKLFRCLQRFSQIIHFPNTCPMKIVRVFYRIIARYGRNIYTLIRSFPNQQWCNKSRYDLVERLLFPLSFYRRYIKFKERYVSKFQMFFNLIHLSSI